MQIDGLIKMWLKSWIRSAAHVTAKGFEYRPFVSTSGIPLIHEIFIEGKDDGVIRWTKHTGLAGKTKDPGSLKIMGYHMLEW